MRQIAYSHIENFSYEWYIFLVYFLFGDLIQLEVVFICNNLDPNIFCNPRKVWPRKFGTPWQIQNPPKIWLQNFVWHQTVFTPQKCWAPKKFELQYLLTLIFLGKMIFTSNNVQPHNNFLTSPNFVDPKSLPNHKNVDPKQCPPKMGWDPITNCWDKSNLMIG